MAKTGAQPSGGSSSGKSSPTEGKSPHPTGCGWCQGKAGQNLWGSEVGTVALTAECRDSFLKDVHCQLGTEGRPGLCIGTVQTEGPMFHYGGVYAPRGTGVGGVERHIWRDRCAGNPTSVSSSNRQTTDLCLADKILCRDNTFLKCRL